MTVILRSGDSGPAVTALQRALIVTGAKLQGTGNFGVLTGAALSAFQAQHGLATFGNADEDTLRILAQASGYPLWMGLGERELGVHETPGPTSTPRVMQYRQIAGCTLDGDDGDVPWCRIYVGAMFAQCGLPFAKNWMARAVEHDPDFVQLSAPAYGAVMSYWRSSRKSGLGHTGFYCGETVQGRVLTLGGNENDAVRKAFYPRDSGSMGVTGFYWPKSVPVPKLGRIIVADDGTPVATAV